MKNINLTIVAKLANNTMNPSNSLAPKHSSILAGGDRDDDNFSCATVRASNVTQEKKYQVKNIRVRVLLVVDSFSLLVFVFLAPHFLPLFHFYFVCVVNRYR